MSEANKTDSQFNKNWHMKKEDKNSIVKGGSISPNQRENVSDPTDNQTKGISPQGMSSRIHSKPQLAYQTDSDSSETGSNETENESQKTLERPTQANGSETIAFKIAKFNSSTENGHTTSQKKSLINNDRGNWNQVGTSGLKSQNNSGQPRHLNEINEKSKQLECSSVSGNTFQKSATFKTKTIMGNTNKADVSGLMSQDSAGEPRDFTLKEIIKKSRQPESSSGSGNNFQKRALFKPKTLMVLSVIVVIVGVLMWRLGPKLVLLRKEGVIQHLHDLYKTKLLPLESRHKFHDFYSGRLEGSDFYSEPMIMVVGQYATGKTTFIRYLLQREYPGSRIGPEVKPDTFYVVMHDEYERLLPDRLKWSNVKSMSLKGITIIDSPGIRSDLRLEQERGYDFTGVLQWFGERVDKIIFMFDAHKLDISDELKRAIERMRGQEDKFVIVLNKAHMIEPEELVRVYGALMWSLGKVLKTPEVAKVYLGQFSQTNEMEEYTSPFEADEEELQQDLHTLLKNPAMQKLNDLTKRARSAKVHAYIISSVAKYYKSLNVNPPDDGLRKKHTLQNLQEIYVQIQEEYHISAGDLPDINKMREQLMRHNFSTLTELDAELIKAVDQMLEQDLGNLMARIASEGENLRNASGMEDDEFSFWGIIVWIKDYEKRIRDIKMLISALKPIFEILGQFK